MTAPPAPNTLSFKRHWNSNAEAITPQPNDDANSYILVKGACPVTTVLVVRETVSISHAINSAGKEDRTAIPGAVRDAPEMKSQA